MQIENKPGFAERMNLWIKQSVTLRIITIGILILLLLIPVSMVESLIHERENRQQEAIAEVSAKWGEEQTITGLVLTVPYKTFQKVYEDNSSNKFRLVESRQFAHFLPETLNIDGAINPEKRYRGIYEIIVYNSKLRLNGSFRFPDFNDWKTEKENIIWEDAFLSLGISDLRSVQENISVEWNTHKYFFNPGIETHDVIANGISTRIKLNPDSARTTGDFSLSLNLNGSSGLNFIPLGKITQVKIKSPWTTPSFDGAFLPDQREISGNGFSAAWKVLHLNRPYPQSFRGPSSGISESGFGVKLIVPVDEYQKSMRSAKYAVMFITLTFLVFFFVQMLNGVRIHPIQYIIVGLALCVFYTLLVAMSEHISFAISYVISSIAIISLITLYAKAIFRNRTLTRLIFLILLILYLFIYSIIQLEDYALLMGSIGLFIVLAVIMYLSRKIDWYALNNNERGGDIKN